MNRRILSGTFAALLFPVLMAVAGCDTLTQTTATPPDKLPPLPEKCVASSNIHKNAVLQSYSSSEVSQMQVARVANEFAECAEKEGLSRADAKGMLKKNEEDAKQEIEKSGGSGGPVIR